MSDETTIYKVDLDDETFLQKAQGLVDAIKGVGNEENLAGLVSALGSTALAVGVVGAAMFAVKAAFDLTLEAESIQKVNDQFKFLTEQAGISTDALKSGLIEASAGLVDEVTLLRSANEAMVIMGASADKLPQLMDLARKSASVMGGTVESAFNSILKGVESGNQRMLKHQGIIVDVQKAYDDFAKTLGVNSDELDKAGKVQAILNAVLGGATENLRAIIPPINNTSKAWQQFKVALTETKDIAVLAYDKIFGGVVRAEVSGLAAIMKDAKTWFVDHFGSGAEQAAAHAQRFQASLMGLKGELIDLEQVQKRQTGGDPILEQGRLERMDVLKAKILEMEGVMIKDTVARQNEEKQLTATTAAEESNRTNTKFINQEMVKKNTAKFHEEVSKLSTSAVKLEMELTTDLSRVEALTQAQIKDVHQKTAADIEKINVEYKNKADQRSQLTVLAKRNEALQIQKIEETEYELRKKIMANILQQEQFTWQSVTIGWQQSADAVGTANQSAARVSSAMFDVATNEISNSLAGMAQTGQMSASKMLSAILGGIGKQAIAEGTKAMFAGAIMWNPEMVAVGTAEVAFGMGLAALGGSGGSSTPSVPTPSVSAAPTSIGAGTPNSTANSATSPFMVTPSTLPADRSATTPLSQAQATTAQKSVTIELHGDYIDSENSRRLFMEMIRKETDATDFKYVQVGH